MGYVYLDNMKDAGCYTVGFYRPDGRFEPESDHATRDEAAERVAWLNGAPSREIEARLGGIQERLETPDWRQRR